MSRVVQSPAYAQQMQLIARPAKDGTLAYWVRSLLVAALTGGGGTTEQSIDARYAPAVLAVSSAGEEQRIQRTGTYWQARAACRRLEAERQQLGEAAFCHRYGLPARFANSNE